MAATLPPPPARCSHCHGRVYHKQHQDGSYLTCVLCGDTRAVPPTAVLHLAAVTTTDRDRAAPAAAHDLPRA